LTAFDAYEPWKSNASWLALIELTRDMPANIDITTRLYPVDMTTMKERLSVDLKEKYDVILHVGQAPNSACIQLEEFAVNVATSGCTSEAAETAQVICGSGPDAYRSRLPVREYARSLRSAGIPARVSFHAGTFLCNAIFYWSCRITEDLELPTKSTFVHVPLDTSQVLNLECPASFMPRSMTADALRLLLKMTTERAAEPIA
jgi:pyroglutamyl-peptidase